MGQGISTTTFDYANGLNPDIEKAGGYGIPPGIYSYAFDPKTGLPFVCDPTKTPTGGSPQMAEGGGAVNNPTVTKAVADSKMNDLQSKYRASNGTSTAMNANKEDVQMTSKQRVSVMIPISMIENTTKNHRNSMVGNKAIRSSLNDGHYLTSLYNKLTSTSRQKSVFFEKGPTSHESTLSHSFKKPLFVKLFSNQPKEDKQQTRVKLHKHMDESKKKTTVKSTSPHFHKLSKRSYALQRSTRKHTDKKIMSTKPYTKYDGIILNDRYRTNTPDLESSEEIEEPGDQNRTPLTENFYVQSKKKSGDMKKIKPMKGFRKNIQSSTWSRKNGITIKLPDIPACPDMKNYHWPWNCLGEYNILYQLNNRDTYSLQDWNACSHF